jgi:hypothetical protein
MSTAAITTGKPQLRAIDGGRVRGQQEETGSTRADALFFRSQTLAIVRHFFEIACQIGRLPSILGREFFRAKVSHHAVPSFEEQAVFVNDVERALGRLNEQDAEVIALVGLFQYSLDEVAAILGRSRMWRGSGRRDGACTSRSVLHADAYAAHSISTRQAQRLRPRWGAGQGAGDTRRASQRCA